MYYLFDCCIEIVRILQVEHRVWGCLVRLREKRHLVKRCLELPWQSSVSRGSSRTESPAFETGLAVGMLAVVEQMLKVAAGHIGLQQ